MFFLLKKALFPQFKAKFCVQGRQKARPRPSTYTIEKIGGGIYFRGNETIYLHRSGPLLENGPDRPESRYGRYALARFSSISISAADVDEAGDSL